MPKNTGTIRNTIARFPRADNGANEKLGGCLTATPGNFANASVMHKKGKQNDYWERDS
jgi:hypothetical protein